MVAGSRVRSIAEADVERNRRSDATSPNLTPPEYLTTAEAAEYLRVSSRWLQAHPTVPRVNLADPDARRAMWRYRRQDLDAHMARRVTGATMPRIV
jgi:hypothetical protein